MRATTYSTAALAMLSSFWSPVSGVAVGQDSTSGPFGGKQHAHTLVHMDITDGVPTGEPVLGFPISNSTDVAARRNVDYCIANAAQTGNCIQAAAFLAAIGVGIASILKSDSDNNDCTTHSGGVDSVTWEVYATGKNCNTDAELQTIAGAIDVYLRAQNKSVCGVHCIRLTHGGTYSGYVTLAAPGFNPDNFYCGSAYTFGQCGTGGGNDNHN
ncbi:hypothetical protein GGX14DRAFT_397654 [Mycena pura]|uniref:Secreted protein CSS2 C-terminal domain-containing protein n=1 Tax=Mycena pura TaxID=153505 RepID=A0AAD6YCF3_9AGAR|nr:hypothetical protein GGX14DRAFT_397654 [Mycena pura]